MLSNYAQVILQGDRKEAPHSKDPNKVSKVFMW